MADLSPGSRVRISPAHFFLGGRTGTVSSAGRWEREGSTLVTVRLDAGAFDEAECELIPEKWLLPLDSPPPE